MNVFTKIIIAAAVAITVFVVWKPQTFRSFTESLKRLGNSDTSSTKTPEGFSNTSGSSATFRRFAETLKRLKFYATKHQLSTDYFFIADMSIASGKNRFFVYNATTDSLEVSGLVTHGYGSNSGKVEYSNVPGSNCTSPGHYRIGNKYYGRFGLAYKLYGLDASNSKAFERFVVLHSHECVPDEEISPQKLCESQGCPTVSPTFLKKLSAYIDKSEKPIMLVIVK